MRRGCVRIIAGKYRGRLLKVPDLQGLRPTPDRVRVTVFDWLAPIIQDARCLDLFTGSGAFGFEALSRGAAYVEMVDQAPVVISSLRSQAERFANDQVAFVKANIPQGLPRPANAFDIVFVDPPYQSDLLLPTCHYLEAHEFLANPAYIYLEAAEIIEDNKLPANWQVIKQKKAGQVVYHLVKRML